MKAYSCDKGHKFNESMEKWNGLNVCPECWPNGFMQNPERSKREDGYEFIKGSSDCIALDAISSQEMKEYHKNSVLQINKDGKSYLMRCSEHDGNIVREVQ
jgi:hypothetical protein